MQFSEVSYLFFVIMKSFSLTKLRRLFGLYENPRLMGFWGKAPGRGGKGFGSVAPAIGIFAFFFAKST